MGKPDSGQVGDQRYRIERTKKNGVRVKITHWFDEQGSLGRVVEADCDCYGNDRRLHSSCACPNLRRQERLEEEAARVQA